MSCSYGVSRIFTALFAWTCFCSALHALPVQGTEVSTSNEVSLPRDLSKGSHAVLIFHPNCGFSRFALEQMDSEIWREMNSKGMFLVPAGSEPPKDVQRTQEFIQGKYSISPYVVQKNSNLPGVQAEDFESIPRFLFIQDGKLVHKVVGWPKDGSHLADVKEGFRKLSARPGNK